jgi:hypothetical protein
MRTLRDFCCGTCGQLTEKLVDIEYLTIECPECHGDAIQQMSTPTIKLEGLTGSFPDAHEKWARIREDNARIKAARS